MKKCAAGLLALTLAMVMAAAAVADEKALDENGKAVPLPKLVKRVNPKYPEEAKKDKVAGEVVLEIKIDEAGKVTGAKVVKTADDRLAKAAVEAVRQWEYEPVTISPGKPVKVIATVTMNFRLK